MRDGGPGGQVLLGQARPGPVEAQLRAEHARGRPGSVGIVRHLFGILSGRAAPWRAEVGRDRVRIEVEDAGGPWYAGLRDDGRPHGFDVVTAIAGTGNWDIDGDDRGRIAWARFGR